MNEKIITKAELNEIKDAIKGILEGIETDDNIHMGYFNEKLE